VFPRSFVEKFLDPQIFFLSMFPDFEGEFSKLSTRKIPQGCRDCNLLDQKTFFDQKKNFLRKKDTFKFEDISDFQEKLSKT